MISEGHKNSDKLGETWSGNPLSWKDSEACSWNIELEWAQTDGAPRPVGLTVSLATGDGALNSTLLRKLPIGALARFDLQHEGARRPKNAWGKLTPDKLKGPRRGQPLEPELLKLVARLYEEAVTNGQQPSQSIAKEMDISASTAAKRIMAARRFKFLGQAIPGKKGEVN